MKHSSETKSLTKDEILDQYEFGSLLFKEVVERIKYPRKNTRFGCEDGILEQLAETPPEGKPLTVFYMREVNGEMSIEKMFFTKKLQTD